MSPSTAPSKPPVAGSAATWRAVLAVALSVAAVAVTAAVTWQPRRTPLLAGMALVAGLGAWAWGW